MRHALAWVAMAFLGAGCVASSDSATPESATTEAGPLPEFRFVEAEAEEARSLLAPPKWKQGEWWRIRLDDFTGGHYEVTRVVAGVEGDFYLVGMPRDEFSDDLMVLHLPGFGQVSREDLSFEVHDAVFQALQFPLVDGASWTTAFEARPITTRVFVEGETQARIQFDGAQDHGNVTYDALVGEVVRHDAPAYVTYEVVDHGFNYTGIVTVPHMHDLVFQHFRIAGVLTGVPAASTSITDTIQIASSYDRVSFVLAGLNIVPGAAVAGGYYQEIATAPDGTRFELTVVPTDPAFVIRTYAFHRPGGTWTLEHRAVGPGAAGAEGIAYHTYDVDMATGRVLPSTGEHKHGG